MSKGLIKSCVNANCGWKCCDFGSKGHIVMLPGEYEKAKENTSHLSIVDDDYNGGKKVKCFVESRKMDAF